MRISRLSTSEAPSLARPLVGACSSSVVSMGALSVTVSAGLGMGAPTRLVTRIASRAPSFVRVAVRSGVSRASLGRVLPTRLRFGIEITDI